MVVSGSPFLMRQFDSADRSKPHRMAISGTYSKDEAIGELLLTARKDGHLLQSS